MNNRIVGIDVLKGISIFLVVFYHTITSDYISPIELFDYLGAFLLNAFFFASGWVFANSKTQYDGIKIKKKIMILGIPYVFLSLIAIMYQFLVGTVLGNNFISDTYHGKQLLLRNIYCAVSLTGIGTLWFLPVILICNIVIMLFIKKNNDTKRQMVLMGITCFALYMIYVLFIDRINIDITGTKAKILAEEIRFINRIVIGIVYILLGYLVNKILTKYNRRNITNIIIGLICFLIGAVLYHYNIEFFKLFYTLSECIVVIYLCNYKVIQKLVKPISYLGENSLYIMVVHYIFVQPILMKMIWSSYYCMNSSLFTKRLILFFIEWAVTIVIIELGKRIDGFLFLFGKGERFRKLMRRRIRRAGYYE